MTETDEKGKKKLSLSSGGTLSLGKKIETSQVKQSFSHGRSKPYKLNADGNVRQSLKSQRPNPSKRTKL